MDLPISKSYGPVVPNEALACYELLQGAMLGHASTECELLTGYDRDLGYVLLVGEGRVVELHVSGSGYPMKFVHLAVQQVGCDLPRGTLPAQNPLRYPIRPQFAPPPPRIVGRVHLLIERLEDTNFL